MIRAYVKASRFEDLEIDEKKVLKFEDIVIGRENPGDEYIEIYNEAAGLLKSHKENPNIDAYLICKDLEAVTPNEIFPVWKGYEDKKTIKRMVLEGYARRKVEEGFGSNNVVLINLFKYLNLLTRFAEYGIFINDRNREEQYIEIINKENPELLDYLQEYLDMREYIVGTMAQYDQYMDIINKVS